jgi:putative acetyltransferase
MESGQQHLVRPLGEGDFADVVEIFRHPKLLAGTMQGPFVSDLARSDKLRQGLLDPHSRYMGVEADGRVVGTASVHMNANPRARHVAALGMGIRDSHQGQGLGSALMAAIVDLCDNWLQISRLELEVYTDNEAALALYRKYGFEIEGTHRAKAFRLGEYVDTHSMARFNGI